MSKKVTALFVALLIGVCTLTGSPADARPRTKAHQGQPFTITITGYVNVAPDAAYDDGETATPLDTEAVRDLLAGKAADAVQFVTDDEYLTGVDTTEVVYGQGDTELRVVIKDDQAYLVSQDPAPAP